MKRFTETGKWEKAWYRKLPTRLKCLWNYILDRCDNAGVWEVDYELATFYIGEKVTAVDIEKFEGRLIPFGDNKIRVKNFVYFQWGYLSMKSKPHQAVMKLLQKHGFEPEYPSEKEISDDGADFTAEVSIEPNPPSPNVPKVKLNKDDVMREIFENEVYMEGIRSIAHGKNLQDAFNECWIYHTSQPHPPREVWVWKQKFLTWLTIKKKDNVTGKDKQNNRTKSLIDSFNERHGRVA